jgi:hypothetical protein
MGARGGLAALVRFGASSVETRGVLGNPGFPNTPNFDMGTTGQHRWACTSFYSKDCRSMGLRIRGLVIGA